MSPTIINTITNVIAFLLVLIGALQTYLTSQPFSWPTLIVCILGAVTSYFTGKSGQHAEKKLDALWQATKPKVNPDGK